MGGLWSLPCPPSAPFGSQRSSLLEIAPCGQPCPHLCLCWGPGVASPTRLQPCGHQLPSTAIPGNERPGGTALPWSLSPGPRLRLWFRGLPARLTGVGSGCRPGWLLSGQTPDDSREEPRASCRLQALGSALSWPAGIPAHYWPSGLTPQWPSHTGWRA